MQRRDFLRATLVGSASLVAGSALAEGESVLHIGFQKSSLNLIVLKHRGTLEKRLTQQGVSLRWTEFPAGPQLLEALNVGAVDFGMTGDTPPIFAQAAGTSLVYVGNEPPKPQASAILVGKGSAIRSVADLKGKRVAFNKGSSAHYLVLRALESAGLGLADIQPAYLAPADARAAFERGNVDAWGIWDPYYAAAEKAVPTRTLATGQGLLSNHTFYLAARDFARKRPALIAAVFEELSRNDDFLEQQPQETARILAGYTGLDVPTLETVVARRPSFQVSYLDKRVIDEQQRIADSFYKLGVIPKAINVNDIVWRPGA
ncbi:sulfonate ABC transporter substrate-binding protein [Chitinimonas sp.]|uniref:sulfonate ABC transporter substrate-binding protein n=1 Tax=Chitinimonas sp. TaxID=1934313 RepID=UPI002F925559